MNRAGEEHYPGPWTVCEPGDYGDYDGRCIVILGDHSSVRIAVVLGDSDESKATAKLMGNSLRMKRALEHIARTARASRSQTRRIRWIEHRADTAARGERYDDELVDLPKSAGPNTPEKLNKKLGAKARHAHAVREAAQALMAAQDALDGCGLASASRPFLKNARDEARSALEALLKDDGSEP